MNCLNSDINIFKRIPPGRCFREDTRDQEGLLSDRQPFVINLLVTGCCTIYAIDLVPTHRLVKIIGFVLTVSVIKKGNIKQLSSFIRKISLFILGNFPI